jgi:hypothetical protein
VDGTCACAQLWGGPDCTVDKLTHTMARIAPLIAPNLTWDPGEHNNNNGPSGNNSNNNNNNNNDNDAKPCPFLTASDNPSGRWRYYNEAGGALPWRRLATAVAFSKRCERTPTVRFHESFSSGPFEFQRFSVSTTLNVS